VTVMGTPESRLLTQCTRGSFMWWIAMVGGRRRAKSREHSRDRGVVGYIASEYFGTDRGNGVTGGRYVQAGKKKQNMQMQTISWWKTSMHDRPLCRREPWSCAFQDTTWNLKMQPDQNRQLRHSATAPLPSQPPTRSSALILLLP
jgi:hypothetical protein